LLIASLLTPIVESTYLYDYACGVVRTLHFGSQAFIRVRIFVHRCCMACNRP